MARGHAARLREESQSLRYQVYCLDRAFLDPQDYPEGLEADEFDARALHFCVRDPMQRLAGTVRLIVGGRFELPLYGLCPVDSGEFEALHAPGVRVGEISRLAVPRGQAANEQCTVVMQLYTQLYRAAKALRLTHAIALTERSVARLVTRHGIELRPIGQHVMLGKRPRIPYVMSLSQIDAAVAQGRFTVRAAQHDIESLAWVAQ
jgi:N-acyl-L-homoserine lactone synthetase